MFNPYEPDAFERARAELSEMRDDRLRGAIARLLDRLEADPEFCRRWWIRRQEQQKLYEVFGPEQIPYPRAQGGDNGSTHQ